MNIYLVPGRSENFERTVNNSVNDILKEKYNKIYEREVGAWAITNKNKCAIYGNKIKAGDKFLIFPLDESDQLVEATIIETIRDKALPPQIWDESQDKEYYFTFIFSIDNKYTISRKRIYQTLGYKFLWGITELSISKALLLQGFIEGANMLKKDEDFIESNLIDKYWKQGDISVVLQQPPKNKKDVSSELSTKPPKEKSESGNKNIPIKQVGLTGENIFYRLCCEGKFQDDIKRKLGLNGVIECNWYNKEIDLNDKNYQDKSVGHGHDMKIADSIKKVFEVEIKTSYNKMQVFTLTRNELKEMSRTQNVYVLVLIDKISSTPRIRFLSNFKDLFSKELSNMAKELPIYVENIPVRYFL